MEYESLTANPLWFSRFLRGLQELSVNILHKVGSYIPGRVQTTKV